MRRLALVSGLLLVAAVAALELAGVADAHTVRMHVCQLREFCGWFGGFHFCWAVCD